MLRSGNWSTNRDTLANDEVGMKPDKILRKIEKGKLDKVTLCAMLNHEDRRIRDAARERLKLLRERMQND